MHFELAEDLLYHLADRYLRPLLPLACQEAIGQRIALANQRVQKQARVQAWTEKVVWLSHWDGIVSSPQTLDTLAAEISSALLNNTQINLQYQGHENEVVFNPFALIKRDQDLFLVGSYGQNNTPFILALRKIQRLERTSQIALEPPSDFDLAAFLHRQLNFPHTSEKLPSLCIEFEESLYSYVKDHAIAADQLRIIPPAEYHHTGYFLLEAEGVQDGQRLRQWIRGFAEKAQVLKPDTLRLAMEQARLDARTNLLSATEFKRCCQREILRCQRDTGRSFALIILDLDHFKQINDQYGHDVGDRVLLQVANGIRGYDEAARHGGEEFTVLLPDTQAREAITIAERIRQHIEQQKILSFQGQPISVTASLGVAVYPNDLFDQSLSSMSASHESIADALFHLADQALYRAKAQGRNQVCVARDE